MAAATLVRSFRNLVLDYLENPQIKQNHFLYQFFAKKAEELISLPDAEPLKERDVQLYQWSKELMDSKQKVRSFVCDKILGIATDSHPNSFLKRAIDKRKWEAFIGPVSEETSLPPNIQKILDSPCPFQQGKTVGQTRILLFIPHQVKGQTLSEDTLGKFVQFPQQGNATQYRAFTDHEHSYDEKYKTHSRWVLITREVVPGSLNQTRLEQKKILADHFTYRLATRFEIITALFMEYLCHGARLMESTPPVYAICKERKEVDFYDRKLSKQSKGFLRTVDEKTHQPIVGAYTPKGLEVACFEYEGEEAKRADIGAIFVRDLQ